MKEKGKALKELKATGGWCFKLQVMGVLVELKLVLGAAMLETRRTGVGFDGLCWFRCLYLDGSWCALLWA